MNDPGTRLQSLPTAAVLDGCAGASWAGPAIRPLWRPARVAGPAFTVRGARADNRAFHRAVADAPPGSVVVVATGFDPMVAIFGDLLARVGAARGLAGLVTDGAVRDSDGIRDAGFPVYCGGVALRPPVKAFAGDYGVAVRIGEAEIRDGDWVLGDSDGVVVVPAADIDAAIASAERIEQREAEMVRRAAAGEPTPSQLGVN